MQLSLPRPGVRGRTAGYGARLGAEKLKVVLLFLPPALLLFTLFVILPMGEAIYYSFFQWNGFGRPEDFVGLKNYDYLIRHRAFNIALGNNLLIIAV